MSTPPTKPATNSLRKASTAIIRKQVNCFIVGWLITDSGSDVQITRALWEKLYAMQEKILAHIFDGVPIDSTFTAQELRCCNETVSVFGRHYDPTTAKEWPEIDHDAVPHGGDLWAPPFRPLSSE